MTWEDTIKYIRTEHQYDELVTQAYLSEDLELNVKRFVESQEWKETLAIVRSVVTPGARILDVGCGNGISSVAFALEGFEVLAVDPDPSTTVGINAVKILKDKFNLSGLSVFTGYAEELTFPSESFHLVYCRQSMHHANDLRKFIKNTSKFLAKGGHYLTIRDHVIFDKLDKEKFLLSHPLHKFYNGENAFTQTEYKNAFEESGLTIRKELKYFDSPINYFPITKETIESWINEPELIRNKLAKQFGVFGNTKLAFWLYRKLIYDPLKLLDERFLPGRMYSYLLYKQ